MYDETRGEVYTPGFADNCTEAERLYMEGHYTSAVAKCRACTETLVRLFYKAPLFELPEHLGGKPTGMCSYAELLSYVGFRKAVGDGMLVKHLDDARRSGGNQSSHDMNRTASGEMALSHLRLLHDLFVCFEQQVFYVPLTVPFFEPWEETYETWDEGEETVQKDYPALMDAEEDSEMRAKYAVLHFLDHPDFDVTSCLEVLPVDSDVRVLYALLTDDEALDDMLNMSSVQLSMLVSRIYGQFHWSEIYLVMYHLALRCRACAMRHAAGVREFVTEMGEAQNG
ncbi:MAG: hypothetical protein IJ083_00435 [Clostridia bacterium]|nr:hypothetical protein [Clostridia bacterium]